MIDDAPLKTWQELQSRVAQIFTEIGLNVEIGKQLTTARGTIEIDVYAVDSNSVDKIKYVVECKNWKKAISQTVVHAFTTVMHETGGNIGFLVSTAGFQPGALRYTKNTNIVCLSYNEFQERYINVWLAKYFAPKVGKAFDSFVQYIEPINSRRDKHFATLTDAQKASYVSLLERYKLFGMAIAVQIFPCYLLKSETIRITELFEMQSYLSGSITNGLRFDSTCFRDFQNELVQFASSVTDEFNAIFGKDIFLE
ncbi:MAG: restriction endonuclease [Humidesulfovibrio sp.]